MKSKVLADIVGKIMSGVDQKELHAEGSDLITFDEGWATSFSGEIAVSHKLDTDISCSVSGPFLYQIIKDMKVEDVKLKVEKNTLVISDEDINQVLELQIKERNLSGEKVLKIDEKKFVDIPEDFMDGLKMCSFSASSDPTMEILNSVFFINKEIYSSDNYRLSNYTMSKGIDGEFVLPIKSAKDMLKFGSKVKKYYSDGRWVHFCELDDNDEIGMVYHAMLILGEYPYEKIKEFFDKLEIEKTIDLPKDKIISSISIAKKIGYDESSQSKSVSIFKDKDDFLIVKGEREEIGMYEEVVDAEESKNFPKDIVLNINPDFLNDILAITNKMDIVGDGRGMRFKKDKFQHYMTNTIKE